MELNSHTRTQKNLPVFKERSAISFLTARFLVRSITKKIVSKHILIFVGLLVGKENTSRMDCEQEPEPVDPTLRFYKSRSKRQVAPTMDGKQPIYDFDAW